MKGYITSLFGLNDKIQETIGYLKQYEPPEGYYMCFSGGKDSVVLHDLTVKAGVKFDAHHNNTTVEPPELMRFIIKNYPHVKLERAPITMAQLIVKRKIPPLRTARYCCYYLKERFGKSRVKITGIRAEESARRAKRPLFEENRRKKNDYFLNPILHWTESEIWQYIRENNIPYCELYDRGRKRVGCVLCPFQNGKNVEMDMRDFPAIVNYYLRACRKSYEVNEKYLTYWKSGDDMFNWWINRLKKPEIVEDCNIIPLFSKDDGFIM